MTDLNGPPLSKCLLWALFFQIDVWSKSSGFRMTWQYIEKNNILFFCSGRWPDGLWWGSTVRCNPCWRSSSHCPPSCELLWLRTEYDLCQMLLSIVSTQRYWNVTCGNLLSVPAFGWVEARRPADFACRPGRGEPDATSVWQNGRWHHQNEALDGGDLCAFNRQREAVVKVEVTSFFPFSPPLSFSQWQRWNGVAWSRQRIPRGRLFAACWHSLLLPYHT